MPVGRPLSPDQRWQLQQKYQQAVDLREHPGSDLDQTHRLLAECLTQDPGNAVYLEAWLDTLARKRRDRPQSRPFWKASREGQVTKDLAQQNWPHVWQQGVEAIWEEPGNAKILLEMAQACDAAGFNVAAVLYLQHAVQIAPQDVELHRQLAKALAREARFDEAIQSWQQVEHLAPHDGEAPRMIGMLTLEWSRVSPEGMEEDVPSEAGEIGESSAPDTEARREAAKPRKLVLSQRQQLEQALVNNPEDEANYLTLAELYLQERRAFDAQRILTKALNVSKDLRIVERLEDVNILRAREQVEIARRRAVEERTQEARDLAENLQQELQRLELDIFRARSDRYPDNHALKFELGLRLKRLGRFREAVEPLQGGLEVPEHRAAASLEIGEILQRYKQFPRALQCYRQAVQLAAGEPGMASCRTRALYRAGILAESMGLVDSAQHYFTELVQMDPDYKDARSRLDKLREIDEDS